MKKNNKCNPQIEETHKWSEPDYKYPLMCLDCHILITWVWKLAKLERPLITLEDFSFLNKEQITKLWSKITYEETRLIMNEISVSKYFYEY